MLWPQHSGKSAQVSTSLEMTSVWCVLTSAGTLQVGQAQSDEQVRPTLMDGASPNGLGNGRLGVRSAFPTPTCRLRLVAEVAPNKVDVSAVALPGSPLFVTNVESDGEGVPVSHPWDSDEEDELDTHSRNQAGVPILGQDLRFSVPPTVPASSDSTVGGRPRQFERSRDSSIVATQADNDSDAETERHPLVPQDVVHALESNLEVEVDRSAKENTPVGSTVLARSGAIRRRLVLVGGGRRVVLVPQTGIPQFDQDVLESNDADEESRAVVNHFDMTVADSDLSVEVTPRHHLVGNTQTPSSGTESVPGDPEDFGRARGQGVPAGWESPQCSRCFLPVGRVGAV